MSDRRYQAVMKAVQTAFFTLAKPDTPDNYVEATLILFGQGSAGLLEGMLTQMSWGPEAANVDISALIGELVSISEYLHTLDETPLGPALPRSAHLFRAASELRSVAEGYSAYLLCEVAYELTISEGIPAPEIAELQLELSTKDSEEWNAAAWRCATERCRDALFRGADWVGAIDAFELAMVVPVSDSARQAELIGDLISVLRFSDETPLRVLKVALPVQAPKRYFNPGFVLKVATALLQGRGEDLSLVDLHDADAQSALCELGATMAQIDIDDKRFLLRPAARFSPEISWTDHSLAHAQLVDAVPLQRSLIVDIDRSADTLLELVHEITHAFTLLGPLGWVRTAYRAATQYIEMLLIDQQRGVFTQDLGELEAIGPLTSVVAKSPVTIGLCDAQFAVQLRSKILQAIWTPWLEGLAVYAELLCDPADDESQMFAPLLAIRSLVDPAFSKREGETDEAAHSRAWSELHAAFEAFCSRSIKRTSRLRHLGYLKSKTTPETYLLGYLLVRSIVSRWETTLASPLTPAVAVRLLLDATRNGTWDAIAPIDAGIDTFEAQCRTRLASFLAKLAKLPVEFLKEYFRPLDTPQPRRYSWVGDVPIPLDLSDPKADADTPLAAMHIATRAATVPVALRGTYFESMLSEAEFVVAAATHGPPIADVFDRLHSQSSLVAVGRCDVRVIVLDDSTARVAFCPRTFAGLLGSTDTMDLAVPRYSIRVIELPGGKEGLQSMRRALRHRKRARVVCTRVVDMVGLAQTPFEAANTSYVYFGLADWRLVTSHDTMQSIGPGFERFENLLRLRVEAPALMQQEHLTLANSTWLVGRADATIAALDNARRLAKFEMDDCARRSAVTLCAAAFGTTEAALSAAVANLIGETRLHSAVADYLVSNGIKSRESAAATEIGHIAFDGGALSGIRPHSTRTIQ